MAGRVDAVGDGVADIRIGERVVAFVGVGGFAEVVCVPASQAVALPEHISDEVAAAFALTYATARDAPIVRARVRRCSRCRRRPRPSLLCYSGVWWASACSRPDRRYRCLRATAAAGRFTGAAFAASFVLPWPMLDRPGAHVKGQAMAKSMDKKKEEKKPAQKTAKEKKAAKLEKKKGK